MGKMSLDFGTVQIMMSLRCSHVKLDQLTIGYFLKKKNRKMENLCFPCAQWRVADALPFVYLHGKKSFSST